MLSPLRAACRALFRRPADPGNAGLAAQRRAMVRQLKRMRDDAVRDQAERHARRQRKYLRWRLLKGRLLALFPGCLVWLENDPGRHPKATDLLKGEPTLVLAVPAGRPWSAADGATFWRETYRRSATILFGWRPEELREYRGLSVEAAG